MLIHKEHADADPDAAAAAAVALHLAQKGAAIDLDPKKVNSKDAK